MILLPDWKSSAMPVTTDIAGTEDSLLTSWTLTFYYRKGQTHVIPQASNKTDLYAWCCRVMAYEFKDVFSSHKLSHI